MKMEAEARAMQLQAKDCRWREKLHQARKEAPL